MNPQLVVALVIAGAGLLGGFGTAWKIQGWRMDALEKKYVEQELADERQAAEARSEMQRVADRALRNGMARETALRGDATGSRNALVGLSDAVDQALRAGAASLTTCTVGAAALGDVLKTVSTERRELAEKADRHVNDIQTCRELSGG